MSNTDPNYTVGGWSKVPRNSILKIKKCKTPSDEQSSCTNTPPDGQTTVKIRITDPDEEKTVIKPSESSILNGVEIQLPKKGLWTVAISATYTGNGPRDCRICAWIEGYGEIFIYDCRAVRNFIELQIWVK